MARQVGEHTNAGQIFDRLEHVQLDKEAAIEQEDERQAQVEQNGRQGKLESGKVDANFDPLRWREKMRNDIIGLKY